MPRVLIFFDFDGTIVDSAEAKLKSFLWMFSFLGDVEKKIVNQYLIDFQGLPRATKFDFIYQKVLGIDLSADDLMHLSNTLDILIEKNMGIPKILGNIDHFLEKFQLLAKFYIVSAAPRQEIINTLKRLSLEDYFEEIHGSEITKVKAMTKVISKQTRNYHTFMIGDTLNDFAAAKEVNIPFIGFGSDPMLQEATPHIIDNYSSLPELIGLIEVD